MHVDAYLDYFRQHGHDVHFVTLAPGPRREVPTYDVSNSKRLLKLPGKWSYLPAMLRARRVVRSLAPDIVHAHYATSAGLTAYVCGVHPYVVTAHGTDLTQGVKSTVWRPLLKRILQKADWVNPVSDELRNMILSLGIPAEKVETLTLGIDTKRFAFQPVSTRAPAAPIRLICTRNFEAIYDHQTIIDGLAILANRGVDFQATFVGGGSQRGPLEVRAKERGIGARTNFVGAVPNSQLPELLANNDIYISASRHDGTSLSLLEAMASGVYPVVSDINANRAWIRDGHNGRLHKVGDPQSFAESVLAFPPQSGERMECLRLNRELIVSRGDRMVNLQRLGEVYGRLILTKRAANHPRDIRPAASTLRAP